MRRFLILAPLLAACSGGTDDNDPSPGIDAMDTGGSCELDPARFGTGPVPARAPDASKNVLAVGVDGPSWNGVAISWAQARMYVEILPEMDPRPTLHIKLDPKADCDTVELLRKAAEQHCAARYCSVERTAVPPNGPRPMEF